MEKKAGIIASVIAIVAVIVLITVAANAWNQQTQQEQQQLQDLKDKEKALTILRDSLVNGTINDYQAATIDNDIQAGANSSTVVAEIKSLSAQH